MPIQELRQLARTVAVANARDVDQQRQILGELQNVWGLQLDRGSTAEIDSYFEFAIELLRYLADGRSLGPEETLTLITRFLARAESTMTRPILSSSRRDVVLKMPGELESTELNVVQEGPEAKPTGLVGAPPEAKPLGLAGHATRKEDPVQLNDIAMGELLIHLGIVVSSQVTAAMQQREPGERIGEACVRLGYATPEQIQEAARLQGHLRSHAATKPVPSTAQGRGAAVLEWHQSLLGEVLVDTQAVTRQQLKQALKGQRASGLLLGEVLVQAGACDWNTIRSAIRIQEEMRKNAEDPWRSSRDNRVA